MKHLSIFQRPLALFLVALMGLSQLGCYNRFRIDQSRLSKIGSIKDLTFILLDAEDPISNSWKLIQPNFGQDSLSTQLQKISAKQAQEIQAIKKNHEMVYYKNTILIYVKTAALSTIQEDTVWSLDYKNIESIEVFEHDSGKTFGNVLLVMGSIAAGSLLILFISCNCPFVYAENPDGTAFEGVLYSGAIYPKLERHDWLPMPQLKLNGSNYQIRLQNEINEVQHTNLLELLVIDHPEGVKPIIDKYGQLLTLSALEVPVSATSLSGRDVRPLIENNDGRLFLGDEDQTRVEANDGMVLRFKKPANAKHAKLLINARNSKWMQQAFGAFQDEMGDYQSFITKKYGKKSPKAIQRWINDQQLPMAVWAETKSGRWEKLDYFNTPGPTAFRQDILQLDLSKFPGEDLNIKLEFGFKFWEIDQVAIDFTPEVPVRVLALAPDAAIDNQGQDQTDALRTDDERYYHQPEIGNQAQIIFPAPDETPGLQRSLILHGKGYYDLLHQAPPGKPNVFFLRQFQKPNALPKYSRALWNAAKSTVAN